MHIFFLHCVISNIYISEEFISTHQNFVMQDEFHRAEKKSYTESTTKEEQKTGKGNSQQPSSLIFEGCNMEQLLMTRAIRYLAIINS